MKIRFKYLISGQIYYFEINPRFVDITVPLSSLANVGGSGYGYALRTFGDKTYIAKNPNFDGYENLAIYFPSALQSAVNWNDEKAFRLRITNMMYDHSKQLSTLTRYDGQEMQYDGSGGKCYFTAFVRDEIIEGQTVPRWYIGGFFDVNPTGGVYPKFGTPSNIQGVYNTTPEKIPTVDCFTFNVSANDTNYECLFVAIRQSESAYPSVAYIFDLRMFDGTAPQPTTERNTTTPYGRTGTYNFTSDKMVDVAPSGYSFVNRWAHGLTLYHINDLQAEAIFSEFWGNETLWQMFLNSTVKQIQGVLCMHKVPVPVASGSSTRALSIFGKRVARGELLEQLPLVNSQIVQYPNSPQWVPIEEIYGDYFDYAGQSHFSVYLPFVGTIPVDINRIMGGAIKTVYHVDLLTGNLIARVYGRNAMGNGAEVLLYQGSGNCALHIPYVGNDQGGMKLLGALAGVATAGIATVATGGAASAPALAAISGTAGYALAPHNASVNNIPTEASPLSYPYVCYIMEYPERLLTALQGTQTGFATASGGENTTVSNYSGYTQGFLHADIAGATEAEKAEIERAFENGVII